MNTKKVLIPLAIVTIGLSLGYYLETNYHIKDKLNGMFGKQNSVVEESVDNSQTFDQALVNNEPFKTQSIELPNIIPSNYSLSAKHIADEEYRNGNYSDAKKWWELVCESIDKLFVDSTGKTKAETNSEINIWNDILSFTIDDIHDDNSRLSKDRIRRNILENCPKNTGKQEPINVINNTGNNSIIKKQGNLLKLKQGVQYCIGKSEITQGDC